MTWVNLPQNTKYAYLYMSIKLNTVGPKILSQSFCTLHRQKWWLITTRLQNFEITLLIVLLKVRSPNSFGWLDIFIMTIKSIESVTSKQMILAKGSLLVCCMALTSFLVLPSTDVLYKRVALQSILKKWKCMKPCKFKLVSLTKYCERWFIYFHKFP